MILKYDKFAFIFLNYEEVSFDKFNNIVVFLGVIFRCVLGILG